MLTTLAIAFSMSADAFAAALGKGAALDRPHFLEAVRTGLIFGAIETATPLLGFLAGSAAAGYVEAIDHWIAFVLLGGIGARMIWNGLNGGAEQARPKRHSLLILCATAIGTSIDALAIGVTLAFLDADILVTALAIGLTTFAMVTLGVMIGRLAGSRLGSLAEAAGGLLLIGIGTAILIEHMGWLDGFA